MGSLRVKTETSMRCSLPDGCRGSGAVESESRLAPAHPSVSQGILRPGRHLVVLDALPLYHLFGGLPGGVRYLIAECEDTGRGLPVRLANRDGVAVYNRAVLQDVDGPLRQVEYDTRARIGGKHMQRGQNEPLARLNAPLLE